MYPVDFIVLDMKKEEEGPIILGRPFLSTAHVLVGIYNYKLTLRVRDEEITFGVKAKSINFEANKDEFFMEEFMNGAKMMKNKMSYGIT